MRAVIFSNGEIPSLEKAAPLVKADDFIVSADGGMHFINALDLRPHLLIGDMDSISPLLLQAMQTDSTEVMKFPMDKDETDLELAIDLVKKRGFDECLIIGALGGRMDQTLANIYLMASFRTENFNIYLDDGCERLDVILSQLEIKGSPNNTISLIPLFNRVEGITTKGLRYPLLDEPLSPEKTRGISNVLVEHEAKINIRSGKLLCIQKRGNCQ